MKLFLRDKAVLTSIAVAVLCLVPLPTLAQTAATTTINGINATSSLPLSISYPSEMGNLVSIQITLAPTGSGVSDAYAISGLYTDAPSIELRNTDDSVRTLVSIQALIDSQPVITADAGYVIAGALVGPDSVPSSNTYNFSGGGGQVPGGSGSEPEGILPFSTQVGGAIDSVNLATGNVVINIPVRSKVGKYPFSYALVGNSVPTGIANPPYLTNFDLAGIATVGNEPTGDVVFLSKVLYQGCYHKWSHPVVIDKTGALHEFVNGGADSVIVGFKSPCNGGSGSFTDVTNDDTGLTIQANGAYNAPSVSLTDKAGKATDPFGHGHDVDGTTWNTYRYAAVDTWGQTVVTESDTSTTESYIYQDAAGANQKVLVTYSPMHIKTVWSGASCPLNVDWKSFMMPVSVTLPTGASYALTYEQTPSIPGDITGRLHKITLPSGGYIQYDYSGSTNNQGLNCTSNVIPTLKRTVNDASGNQGTWTYVNSNTVGPNADFTVTETSPVDPSTGVANVTTHYFAGQFETKTLAYEGPATGTPLKTTTICYNGTALANCQAPGVVSFPIQQVDTYVSLNSSAASRDHKTYDPYGDVTSHLSYDFGGALISATTIVYGQNYSSATACTAYAATVYIFNTPCYIHTGPTQSLDLLKTKINNSPTGHPTSISRWTGATTNTWLTTTADFNTNGTPKDVIDAANNKTSFSYDGSCGGMVITSTTLPPRGILVMTYSTAWDCVGGVVKSSTDLNGNVTNYDYKANGADSLYRIKEVRHPDGGVIDYSYSTGSLLPWHITASTSVSASSPTISSTSTLDGIGRTVSTQSTDPNASGGYRYTKTTFNILGQVTDSYNPYFTTADSTYGYTAFTYDALGRVTLKTLNPSGYTVSSSYTNRAVKTVEFPSYENLQTITQVDGLGRVVYTCKGISGTQANLDVPATCPNLDMTLSGFETVNTYDALGNLTATALNGAESRTFTYDGLSRKLTEYTPEGGAKTYVYDTGSAGDLYSRTAPLENQTGSGTVTTTYQHDVLHRLTEMYYDDGITTGVAYNYDETTDNQGVVLTNTVGRLTSTNNQRTQGEFDASYGYDTMGRVSTYDTCATLQCDLFVPVRYVNQYTYDYVGHVLTGMNNIAGDVTMTPTYNSIGQLTGMTTNCITDTTGCVAGTIKSAITYNALGQVVSDTLGNSLINETWSYDTLGHNTGRSSGSAYNYSLTWNPASIKSSSDSVNGAFNYTYDGFNRLTCAYSGTACTPSQGVQALSWTYDEFDNRWNQTVVAGTGFGPQLTFDTGSTGAHKNRVTNAGNTYDAAGNLMSDTYHTYQYDAEGRLLSIDSGAQTYTYNTRGLRNNIPEATEELVYNFDGTLALTVNTGTAVEKITEFYANGHVAKLVMFSPGTTNFLLSDWLGTIRNFATYATGGSIRKCASEPFGEQLSTACQDVTGWFGIGGTWTDGSSNTVNTPARNYSVTQGRWLVPDPAILLGNRYAYVGNNPVNYSDPTGLWSWPSWLGGKRKEDRLEPNPGGGMQDPTDGTDVPAADMLEQQQETQEAVNQLLHDLDALTGPVQPLAATIQELPDVDVNASATVLGVTKSTDGSTSLTPAVIGASVDVNATLVKDPSMEIADVEVGASKHTSISGSVVLNADGDPRIGSVGASVGAAWPEPGKVSGSISMDVVNKTIDHVAAAINQFITNWAYGSAP